MNSTRGHAVLGRTFRRRDGREGDDENVIALRALLIVRRPCRPQNGAVDVDFDVNGFCAREGQLAPHCRSEYRCLH